MIPLLLNTADIKHLRYHRPQIPISTPFSNHPSKLRSSYRPVEGICRPSLNKAFHRKNLPYFILLCFIMFLFYRKFAGKTNVTDFSFSNIYAKRVRTSRFVLSFLSDPRCRFLYIFRISPYTHLAKVQRWFLFFYIIL